MSKSRRNKQRHKLCFFLFEGRPEPLCPQRKRQETKRNMDRRRVSEKVDRIGKKKGRGDEETV